MAELGSSASGRGLRTVAREGLPVVQCVELKGFEFARVESLARRFDVSKKTMMDMLFRLQGSHELRVLEWGPRLLLVNVADFYRALFDVVPPRQGVARGVDV